MSVAAINHTIFFIADQIRSVQNRGLGGNILEDVPRQLEKGELAAWTGQDHRFIVTVENIRIDEFKDGGWRKYREAPFNMLNLLIADFISKEG